MRWHELIPDELREEEIRNDFEFEKQRERVIKVARNRCNEDPNKEPRKMAHPVIDLPVPSTEASLNLKLAKKKNLDGLYEVLAPGSSVFKSNDYTSMIIEPVKREVTTRNSELAKFGTKAEKQTNLKCYAERRPNFQRGRQRRNS